MKHIHARLILALLVALILALLLAAPALSAEQETKPSGCKIPEDAAKVENKTKKDADSIGEGKRLFESQCALCHGKAGDGKGDLVEPMSLKVKDYRDPAALKDVTDGAMFHVLQKGCGQMPGEEGRLKDAQMWNLINFVRSLAKKSTVAEKKVEPPPLER